jgi:hypothetical protein
MWTGRLPLIGVPLGGIIFIDVPHPKENGTPMDEAAWLCLQLRCRHARALRVCQRLDYWHSLFLVVCAAHTISFRLCSARTPMQLANRHGYYRYAGARGATWAGRRNLRATPFWRSMSAQFDLCMCHCELCTPLEFLQFFERFLDAGGRSQIVLSKACEHTVGVPGRW